MSYVYNNVAIQECRTLSFEMVQERDPSHTDSMWNKYTIMVRGFVSGSTGQFRNDSAAALADLKAKLESPRRPFTYKIGNETLVTCSGLDAKLGPEPLPAKVREVTTGTFMVECGVIVRLTECDDTCNSLSPVVSLRWSQTEVFDENWYSHLTTNGKLIVRSDLLQSADTFRPLATPPLIADYQRIKSSYNLSMDGTILDFSFDDVERDRLPPFPATKASGQFTVQVKLGARRFGTVSVHLEGPKGVSRLDLMVRALQMCYSKMWPEMTGQSRLNPIGMTVKEDMFEPIVDVTMTAELTPILGSSSSGALTSATSAAVRAGIALGAGPTPPGPVAMPTVGLPPAGVGQGRPGIAPPTRKRLQALLAAAFRDPCACEGYESTMSTGNRGVSFDRQMRAVPTGANPFSLTIGANLPEATTSLRTDAAPYDIYMIKSKVVSNPGVVQMPGTGMGPSGGVAQMARVSGGSTQMLTTWVAGRTGAPPVLPAPETTNTNLVLVDGGVTNSDTQPNADGSALVYLCSGFFIYAVLNPALVELTSQNPPYSSTAVLTGSKKGDGFWASIANASGVTNANPFVPGGISPGETPTAPLGFDQIPPGVLPIGGFTDLGNAGGDPSNAGTNQFGTSIFENAGADAASAGGDIPPVPTVNP